VRSVKLQKLFDADANAQCLCSIFAEGQLVIQGQGADALLRMLLLL